MEIQYGIPLLFECYSEKNAEMKNELLLMEMDHYDTS